MLGTRSVLLIAVSQSLSLPVSTVWFLLKFVLGFQFSFSGLSVQNEVAVYIQSLVCKSGNLIGGTNFNVLIPKKTLILTYKVRLNTLGPVTSPLLSVQRD